MQEIIIRASNTALSVKEWQNQRVVTFKDIDEVHNRPAGTASRNFNSNRKHFVEGEDYFKLSHDDISSTKFVEQRRGTGAGLYVLTESGYLMLAKSLTDKLAWEVQRQLVKSYFKIQEDPVQSLAATVAELVKSVQALTDRDKAPSQPSITSIGQYTPPPPAPPPVQPLQPPPPRMRTRDKCIQLLREEEPETAITRHGLEGFIRRGVIPYVRVGNKLLVNYDKLVEYLNSCTDPPSEDVDIVDLRHGQIKKIKI